MPMNTERAGRLLVFLVGLAVVGSVAAEQPRPQFRTIVGLHDSDFVEALDINNRGFIVGLTIEAEGLFLHGYLKERRHVSVSDYNLPEEMRPRAREIADAASSWVGKGKKRPST